LAYGQEIRDRTFFFQNPHARRYVHGLGILTGIGQGLEFGAAYGVYVRSVRLALAEKGRLQRTRFPALTCTYDWRGPQATSPQQENH
jgi:hypothetical protein